MIPAIHFPESLTSPKGRGRVQLLPKALFRTIRDRHVAAGAVAAAEKVEKARHEELHGAGAEFHSRMTEAAASAFKSHAIFRGMR